MISGAANGVIVPLIRVKRCSIAPIIHSLPYLVDLGFVIVLRVKQVLAINPERAVTAKQNCPQRARDDFPQVYSHLQHGCTAGKWQIAAGE
jgi:hypothetical protein